MKTHLLMSLIRLAVFLTLISCENIRSYPPGDYWTELGVISEDSHKNFYVTLDNNNTLWCSSSNLKNLGVRLNQRVLINYSILNSTSATYSYNVRLHKLDTILTKSIIPINGVNPDSIGDDPIQVYRAWISGDFVNFYYTITGGGKRHHLNLAVDTAEHQEPITLQLRHNSMQDTMKNMYAGYISFRLASLRSYIRSDSTHFKLRYKTKNGEVFTDNIAYAFKR